LCQGGAATQSPLPLSPAPHLKRSMCALGRRRTVDQIPQNVKKPQIDMILIDMGYDRMEQ
jgi:hypothetical protein